MESREEAGRERFAPVHGLRREATMTVHTLSQSSNLRQPALQERLAPQSFPKNAHAVTYRPTRSAMTSGKARTREWKLRFERRAPPFIEPLMGWTGGDDTLACVELTFPSARNVGYRADEKPAEAAPRA